MELNARKRQILKMLIDAYIETGEPIGSKYLSEQFESKISSATIRNELNDLVQMGYLQQLHTSSGRVPSNIGYREYVDNLMEDYRLTMQELGFLNSFFGNRIKKMQNIIDEATRLLSVATRYTAVSLTTRPRSGNILKFNGIYINEHNFYLVMITSLEVGRSRQIRTDFSLTSAVVDEIAECLNAELANAELRALDNARIERLKTRLGPYASVTEPIVGIVREIIREVNDYEINVEGISNLLNYPEFSDLSTAKELLVQLEHKEDLIRRLTRAHEDGTNIYIGENDDVLDSSSMIVRTFTSKDGIIGAVGIIGPKRMDYSGAVAKLEYVAKHLISEQSEVAQEYLREDEK